MICVQVQEMVRGGHDEREGEEGDGGYEDG